MKFSFRNLFGLTDIDNNIEERKSGIKSFTPSLMLGCGTSFNTDKSMTLSGVYRAVNCISEAVSQLPIDLYKIDSKGYKIKDIKNPLYKILNTNPNKRMTRFTMMQLIIQSMLLRGQAYIYILRNSNGEIEQLIYIPSEYVTIVPPKYIFEPVTYRIVGINETIQENELLHFINYSNDGVNGISTIQFAHQSLGIAYEQEVHAQNFFVGGGAVAGVIESDRSLNDDQKEELSKSWNQAHGLGNQNKIALLENGVRYKPIGISPKDAELLESRVYSIQEISRWFAVPLSKLSELSKSSYSTIEASNIQFLSDCLNPLLQKIELEMERKLFPNGDYDIKFNVSELLRTDKSSQASYYQSMFNIGAISVNEIRKEIDLPPIQNGDNNFVQVNLQTIDKATSEEPKTSEDIKEELNN